MRGGPEKWQVTGWLQIIDLQKTHEGDYTCIAQNEHGVDKATARLNVVAPGEGRHSVLLPCNSYIYQLISSTTSEVLPIMDCSSPRHTTRPDGPPRRAVSITRQLSAVSVTRHPTPISSDG